MFIVIWIVALILYISYGDKTDRDLGVWLLAMIPLAIILQATQLGGG